MYDCLLSQSKIAQSVKKRYDILEFDLVGEDESVDCPECGKECEGRESIVQHYGQAEGHMDPTEDSSLGYVKKRQIFNQIAESSSFDWRTVSNLLSVASIPEQFHAFVKIPEETPSSLKEEYFYILFLDEFGKRLREIFSHKI